MCGQQVKRLFLTSRSKQITSILFEESKIGEAAELALAIQTFVATDKDDPAGLGQSEYLQGNISLMISDGQGPASSLLSAFAIIVVAGEESTGCGLFELTWHSSTGQHMG